MKASVALKKIGTRLRTLRRLKGHSSYEYFAYEYDLSKNTLKNMEQGKNFEMATLLRVLEILKVSPEEFFKGIK
jgi:transcriptional regulator with XRE-family HTH domain